MIARTILWFGLALLVAIAAHIAISPRSDCVKLADAMPLAGDCR